MARSAVNTVDTNSSSTLNCGKQNVWVCNKQRNFVESRNKGNKGCLSSDISRTYTIILYSLVKSLGCFFIYFLHSVISGFWSPYNLVNLY